MIRALVIAGLAAGLVAATTRTATAEDCGRGDARFDGDDAARSSGQRDDSYVVPILRLDAGVVMSRFALQPRHLDSSGLAPGIIDATGGMFSFSAGLFGVYFSGELQLHRFDARSDESQKARMIGQPAVRDARAGQVTLAGGYRVGVGRVMFGAEAALGIRNLWLDGADSEMDSAAQGILDLRGHAGLWLTPFVNVSVKLGTSVLRQHEHSAVFTIGVNGFPWDGLR